MISSSAGAEKAVAE